LLPPQEDRWSAGAADTQAWIAKVRQRQAVLLAQGARPTAGDSTGANFSYVEGLRHMRARDYAAAVERFSEAIDRNPNDARYFYLRGMARHQAAGGKDLTEAERDVRRAAELEKQNSPMPRTVDQALERFQGPSRLWAEKFRR
jgi:Flp pilus assembly protein TadD